MVGIIEALGDGRLQDRLAGQLSVVGLAVLAFLICVHSLGFSAKIVFNETHYVKDVWGLLHSGYGRQWLVNRPLNTDTKIADDDLNGFTKGLAAVVHPPLDKQLIAIGEHFFGMTPFRWRTSTRVFGALLMLLTVRLARHLSCSTLVGGIAGLLITFNGLAFIVSGITLLDILQTTFMLAAIATLVVDHD